MIHPTRNLLLIALASLSGQFTLASELPSYLPNPPAAAAKPHAANAFHRPDKPPAALTGLTNKQMVDLILLLSTDDDEKSANGGGGGGNTHPTVTGYVDGIYKATDGSDVLQGWTCTIDVPRSSSVYLYRYAGANAGGTLVGEFPANLGSEGAIGVICGDNEIPHRFVISLERYKAAFGGQGIWVYGISLTDGSHHPLTYGEGKYKFPLPAAPQPPSGGMVLQPPVDAPNPPPFTPSFIGTPTITWPNLSSGDAGLPYYQ
ncbi:hypothetical protein [Chitinivorax sp. B]|uniref:hypothetical protein n=1 Tax=Chitinivorax sp. B TaxID=2502235 RepID=UPI0010F5D483|nr:hypothetical protein [Chitinivorax sp. B]